MARYQVILSYDGTDFSGFQRQAHKECARQGRVYPRTVQGVVEVALRKLGWQGRSILAAGRTDSGVHATGQVIAFDLDWVHTLLDLRAALNANLPPDVAASAVNRVEDGFHPRYDALARCYHYRILCQPVRNPLQERYAWRVWPVLQVERVRQAAEYLVGVHDFAAFGTPPRPGGTTIREVIQAQWWEEEDELVFKVKANAFLYHMVRRLVRFQVQIGQAKVSIGELARRLEEGTQEPVSIVQGLAPPQGLTLVEVVYPGS